MRAIDIALASFALRTSETKAQMPQRRLVPAIDDATTLMLDRAATPPQRAALIASLWPPARQCVVPPVYAQLSAPAILGAAFRVSWPVSAPTIDARALQARLRAVFPRTEEGVQV